MSKYRVLTIVEEGIRIGVSEPGEVFAVLTDLLNTGYSLDQIEWEES